MWIMNTSTNFMVQNVSGQKSNVSVVKIEQHGALLVFREEKKNFYISELQLE